VSGFGSGTFGGGYADAPTGVLRWKFYDPLLDETYTVPMNPKEMTSPWPERKFLYRTTTAGRNGANVIYEGRADLAQWSFSGTVLEQDHYDALKRWSEKPNACYIWDHFGRPFKVLFHHFDPKPKMTYNHRWRHDYTMTVAVFPPATGPMRL
jgi:hypothetical protein